MNKKGFTLVELLVVIILIAAIVLLALPKITDSVKNNTDNVDKIAFNIIKEATKLYVSDNSNLFHKKENKIYCIKLNELVDNKYLKAPILYNGLDVTNTKVIKITYQNGFNYELKDKEDCKILPNDYQQVEYIESTGTQWIDTGIIPEISAINKPIINIKFRFTDISTLQRVFGVHTNIGQYFQLFLNQAPNNSVFGIQAFNGEPYTTLDLNSNIYDLSINFENDTLISNGETKTLTYSNNTASPLTIYLFGRNSAGTASTLAKIKLYSFEYQDSTIHKNFIPCYRKADNVAGMYDLVENKFYTNLGTGNFLKGQDI